MTLPQLIIFEGVDAAGKSTVCSEYVSFLEKLGTAAKLLSFPGKEPRTLGHLVYRLHHNPPSVGVDSLTAASLQALHIAAHLDVIEKVIVPSLESGMTVVLDRFWWSTWVYGIIGGVRPEILESLIEAERIAWGRWQPGVLFHLTRSTPLREEPLENWTRLQREYDALVARESRNYPIRTLPNEGNLQDTVSKAIAESYVQQ